MKYTLLTNKAISVQVWEMWLAGDTSSLKMPGQFVQISLPGFFLRRPISVCEWNSHQIRLIYKDVGKGTHYMTGLQPGTTLDLLAGLGNGFNPDFMGMNALLVGGGVGLPPLFGLCKSLLQQGKKPTVVAGFQSSSDIFLKNDFENLGVQFIASTIDGSTGIKGLVTDAMEGLSYDSIAACGPIPMMKAIAAIAPHNLPAYFSLEERMGCGFGACMGCSIQTKNGSRRVCFDGPVFRREELQWD